MKDVRAILTAFLALAASAAGLLLNIGNPLQAGESGSFEVVLTNSGPGTSHGIFGFSFELDAPAVSNFQFTDATIATASRYIFAGTGDAEFYDMTSPLYDPAASPLALSNAPVPIGADLVGADAQFVSPYDTTLAPGEALSRGLVRFTAGADVSLSELERSFVVGGTTLADIDGSAVPFALPSAAAPEPSSLVMTGLAGA